MRYSSLEFYKGRTHTSYRYAISNCSSSKTFDCVYYYLVQVAEATNFWPPLQFGHWFQGFCLSDATDIGGCFCRLSFHKLPYKQGTAFLVGVACLCPSNLIAGAAASQTPNLVS